MFLHLLTDEHRDLFFRTAHHLAAVDGINAREEELLEAARVEVGLDELPPAPSDVEGLIREVASIESPVARNVFGLELAGLVYADGNADQGEVAVFRDVMKALGLTPERVDEFADFARRSFDLLGEGRALIAEEDSEGERPA